MSLQVNDKTIGQAVRSTIDQSENTRAARHGMRLTCGIGPSPADMLPNLIEMLLALTPYVPFAICARRRRGGGGGERAAH